MFYRRGDEFHLLRIKPASNNSFHFLNEVFQLTKLKSLLLPGTILFCMASAFAQPGSSKPALLVNPVYQNNCAKCRGKTAGGHFYGGPSLVDARVTAAPVDELTNFIANGKGRMPKYAGKLTPDEIDVGQAD